jgi:sulfur carrier protein
MLHIFINQQPHTLDDNATVLQAIAAAQAQPPFAIAVNTQFVPQSRYAAHLLQDQDRIDIISPVTGG